MKGVRMWVEYGWTTDESIWGGGDGEGGWDRGWDR